MEKDDIFGWIASLLLLILITFGFICVAKMDEKTGINYQKQQQALVDSIGGQGEIVAIYGYRIGTKTANYQYPVKCVVEGSNGKRIVIDIKDDAPILHDVWNVCLKGSEASLCGMVKPAE